MCTHYAFLAETNIGAANATPLMATPMQQQLHQEGKDWG